MPQSYLIFVQDRKLKVEQGPVRSTHIEIYTNQDSVFTIERAEKLFQVIKKLEKGEVQAIKCITADADLFFREIKSCYDKFIVAAGGIVQNEKGELLVIFRNGKWDLPKGKIEKEEEVAEGALREVKEETGLKKLKLLSEFHRTYHTYTQNKMKILKETIWFSMLTNEKKTCPQHEEGITEIKWIGANELDGILSNTYENISLLIKMFFGRLT